MANAALKLMTVEDFLHWQRHQEARYELVDGVPVLMAGASTRHDTVLGNIFATLHSQLRGTPCRPGTADVGVRTRVRSLRRADVLVYCDRPSEDTFEATDVRVVVEVLSPSNRGIRWQRKLEEYRAFPGLTHVLLVETDTAAATLLTRTGESWSSEDWDGLDGVITLPAIGATLAMADVYRGVEGEG